MDKWQLSALFLSLFAAAADTQTFRVLVRDGEVTALAGDTVTLSVRPSAPVISGRWKYRSTAIVTWSVESLYLNVAYTKRNVELLDSTSLRLRSVGPADSGVYRLTVDSPSGQKATANITLHVVPKPAPFSLSTERRVVNATVGDTVGLRVTPSMEVRNGSWQIGGKVVARWTGEAAQVAAGYRRRASLFDQKSLQLNAANTTDSGEYRDPMSTGSGVTETARMQLNVFREAESLTVVAVRRHITAEIRATVLLSVRVTGMVKNGTWWCNGWALIRWNDTNINATHHMFRSIHLFHNGSLLLLPTFVDRDDNFTITVSSPTGEEASANITVRVYAAKGTCDAYNSVLGLLILLTLAFILFFVVFIHNNRPNDYMQTFDILVIFCKGYRTCLSFAMILTMAFVLMFGVKVNKNMCTLGQRPEMDFVVS